MEPDFSGCAFLGQEPSPVQSSEGRRGRCSLPHGESNATNCGNPRSWMYESYGLEMTMLTSMIVDCGTRLKKQAQDFSLQTHNKPSAQRSW